MVMDRIFYVLSYSVIGSPQAWADVSVTESMSALADTVRSSINGSVINRCAHFHVRDNSFLIVKNRDDHSIALRVLYVPFDGANLPKDWISLTCGYTSRFVVVLVHCCRCFEYIL